MAAPAADGGGVLRIGDVDLADPGAAERAMAGVVARFGRLDALVNVAGGFRWQTLADGPFAGWGDLYRMNVLTAAAASKAALPHLAASGRGAIVNVGANGAVKAAAGMGAYAAAKGGVHRLTESLAEELKGKLRVNAILPSILDTPANRADMPKADPSAWVSPAEAAAVILFLASDASSAITGALLPVTGQGVREPALLACKYPRGLSDQGRDIALTGNPPMEHLDVLVVGAGISGIGAGYHLQTLSPGRTYAIFEGREALGGTWDLFRYPGIRSDSDMFTLGYSFKPWTQAKAIADGPSILGYLEETSREYGIDRHIRYQHKVVGAAWDSGESRWTVDVEQGPEHRRTQVSCNFLYMCTGYYNYAKGYRPHFEGEETFAGPIPSSRSSGRPIWTTPASGWW